MRRIQGTVKKASESFELKGGRLAGNLGPRKEQVSHGLSNPETC